MYIHVFVDHVSFDRLSLCTFDLSEIPDSLRASQTCYLLCKTNIRITPQVSRFSFDRSLQQQQRQLRHLEIVTAVGDCCWVEIEKKTGNPPITCNHHDTGLAVSDLRYGILYLTRDDKPP